MRRSICYCEPNMAFAGEINTWRFVYTPSINLPKGTKLKFDIESKGRSYDWQIPSTNLKKAGNLIYAEVEGLKTLLPATEIKSKTNPISAFEFILTSKLAAGETFTIVLGSPKTPERGNQAQLNSQRRRVFNLYVDPKGKGQYDDPEIFTLDIRGSELKNIRILVPSFVTRNKRFDVIVRFEDEYGNLTNQAPDDTVIELSHEHLRENLVWKLFVPETGFITLPNLYFNEPGVYTIQLLNTKTKEIFKSAPIMCFADNNQHLFWGLLHGESERLDSSENIENCLRHFRDDRANNFHALSPFESQEETSNETWKHITQNATEFDEADRFTTFIGFQWMGAPTKEGLRHIIYSKDSKQILRKKDPKYTSLKNLYKNFSPKDIISIPCWTMAKGFDYDFKDFDPNFERVVEIYNSWGSSECTQKNGSVLPIGSETKKGVLETAEGSIQKALLKNCRFGFVAGGLDDRGIYGGLLEAGQYQYPPGLTAIIATEHSRSSLAEALYNRSCYATTGERIIVGISLAGSPMGSELHTGVKQGLKVNRHLSGHVVCTTQIAKVEIIRNDTVIKVFKSDTYWLEFTYDDMTPLEKVVIDAKDKKPPFVFYYLRVTQVDGHMAWSSPIWIDLVAPIPIVKPAAKKEAAKPIKKVLDLDLDEDEEDDDFDDEDDEDDDE